VAAKQAEGAELALDATSALDKVELLDGDDGAGAASSKDDYEDDAFYAALRTLQTRMAPSTAPSCVKT
jgi:hypothetical protein